MTVVKLLKGLITRKEKSQCQYGSLSSKEGKNITLQTTLGMELIRLKQLMMGYSCVIGRMSLVKKPKNRENRK